MIGKRPADAMLGGLWEVPGGKVNSSETIESALIREIAEELNIAIAVKRKFIVVKHAYSHFKIELHVYWCYQMKGKLKPIYHQQLKWVPLQDIDCFAFPGANKKIIEKLKLL